MGDKTLKDDPTKTITEKGAFNPKPKKVSKLPGRIGTALGVASMMVPAAYGIAKQFKDSKSAKNRDEYKVKNSKPKEKGFLDKFTGVLNKAGEAYKDLGQAGLNVIRGNVGKYSEGMSKEDIEQEGKKGRAAAKALGESLRDKNVPMKRQRLADRNIDKKSMGGEIEITKGKDYIKDLL